MPHVLRPFALVNSSIFVHDYTTAFSLPSDGIKLSSINTVSVLFDAEGVGESDCFIIELVADHIVLFDRVAVILELVLARRWSETLHLHFFHDLLIPLD